MKSIKEMLLETLKNGPEVLTDITACRRNGKDIITEIGRVDKKIAEYHPKMLNLEVSEIIPNGNEAKTFRLTSENGYLPPFLAGQFINLFVETAVNMFGLWQYGHLKLQPSVNTTAAILDG